MQHVKSLAALAVVVGATGASDPVPGPPAVTAADVAAGWKAYIERLHRGSGVSHIERVESRKEDGKTRTASDRFAVVYACRQGCCRVEEANMDGSREKERRAKVFNNLYAFQLVQRPEGWLLKKVETMGDNKGNDIVNSIERTMYNLPLCLGTFAYQPLGLIAPYVKVTGVEGAGYVLESSGDVPDPFYQGKRLYRNLRLVVGRGPYFPLLKSEADVVVTGGVAGHEQRVLEFRYNNDLPIPINFSDTSTYTGHGTELTTEVKCVIDFDPAVEKPETDFTLSAFGLPEPRGVTWERPTPRYVYLLAAAAGLASLALILRRLGRRRASPTATRTEATP